MLPGGTSRWGHEHPERVWVPLIWPDPNVQQADEFKVRPCCGQARSITGPYLGKKQQLLCPLDTVRLNYFYFPFPLFCYPPLAPVPFLPPPYFFWPFLSTSLPRSISHICPHSLCFLSGNAPQRFFKLLLHFSGRIFFRATGQAVQLIGSNSIKVSGSWLGSDVWETETRALEAPLSVQPWLNKWTRLLHRKK